MRPTQRNQAVADFSGEYSRLMFVVVAPRGMSLTRDGLDAGCAEIDWMKSKTMKSIAQLGRARERNPLEPFPMKPFDQQQD